MKQQKKKHLVPTDQDYIDNLNLVTGAKFNYDKQLPAEIQIQQLCIDEKMSKVNKFITLLAEGQKIQKWSVLENLRYYYSGQDDKSKQKILDAILKNYSQLREYLGILSGGLLSIVNQRDFAKKVSKNIVAKLYQIVYRTLTFDSSEVNGQWQFLFQKVAKMPYLPEIDNCKEFIRGAFQMTSPPEKRKSGLIMICAFFQISKQIESQAYNKVLFFDRDQNAKSRQTIGKIMYKILLKKPNDQQVWKIVWEYFHDKQQIVRNKATKVISEIFYQPNFKKILSSVLTDESSESLLLQHIEQLLGTYSSMFKSDKKSQMQLIAFCNRIFKSNNLQSICSLLKKIYIAFLPILGEGKIFSEINFSHLNIKQKQIVSHLFQIHDCAVNIQFKQQIKGLIFKALKENKYEVSHNILKLTQILQLNQEQQANIYYLVFGKCLQNSKWYQIKDLLSVFSQLKLYQSMYDKFSLLLLKLFLGSPDFLVELVAQSIVCLMLQNRRSLQFLITCRQKLLNSKFWKYRAHYIVLYAALKRETSFEYHKLVPSLIYKNIMNEKCIGVKLIFLQICPLIYKHTQPDHTAEKNAIKETVARLAEEKDKYIKTQAFETKKRIQAIDRDPNFLHQLYHRNKQLIQKQQTSYQVVPDPRKTIKTQNQIRKSLFKKKTYAGDTRKTINLIRDSQINIHKDISIDSISTINGKIKGSNNMQVPLQRKNNLFRCHSVKIKVPNGKKK